MEALPRLQTAQRQSADTSGWNRSEVGGMAEESYFVEESFYGQSGHPSSIPSYSYPTPSGMDQAAKYTAVLTSNQSITLGFNVASSGTLTTDIHNIG